MQEKQIETKSAKETQEAAGRFAAEILEKSGGKSARVVCLWGDLGSGKTTFVQGVAAAAGVRGVVNSPTFLIMKKYPLGGKYKGGDFYHFDCYRVKSAAEVADLGWDEIIADADNLIFVEWPEKIMEILPEERTDISFDNLGADKRRIVFKERQ
jgi:tRNA threonylcarbamoyladenosine biosynthesis protein TsaE